MKKSFKYIVGFSVFCIAFALNIQVITGNYGEQSIKIGAHNCQAGIDPGYWHCQSGVTTYLGNDGSVVAFWCGDCKGHAIFPSGAGYCRLWSSPNPN